MNTFLHDLLLINVVDIRQVYKFIQSVSFPLVITFFIAGAIYENLTNYNFVGLLKRAMLALFLIYYGSTFYQNTVFFSFEISDKLISSVNTASPITQLIERAKKISKLNSQEKTDMGFIDRSKLAANKLWESQAFAMKLLLDDGPSSAVFILSYTVLRLLGQFYTLIYNFTYVSLPFLASMILFPPTYSIANSISRTIAWSFLMPPITTITIILLSFSFSFPQDASSVFYFTTFENLINFLLMACMLCFVPVIASGLLSGSGVLTAAETFSKATVTAALTGGKGLLLNGAKSFGGKVLFDKNFGVATFAKEKLGKSLDKLGNKSMGARERLASVAQSRWQKSSGEKISSSMDQSLKTTESNVSNQQSNSSKKQSTSFVSRSLDRSIVVADNALNFKKNYLAKSAINKDTIAHPDLKNNPERRVKLFNDYKSSVHKQTGVNRPIENKVQRLRRGEPINHVPQKNYKKRNNNKNQFHSSKNGVIQ